MYDAKNSMFNMSGQSLNIPNREQLLKYMKTCYVRKCKKEKEKEKHTFVSRLFTNTHNKEITQFINVFLWYNEP